MTRIGFVGSGAFSAHLSIFAITLAASVAGRALGQVFFDDVTSKRGILPYEMMEGFGAGFAAADFDDDGDIDVFVPTAAGTPNQLYRNLGDGTFEEIAAQAGVASLGAHRAALWFDYDGDTDLDLVVTGEDCWADCMLGAQPLFMYEQTGDAVFEEVTEASGLVLVDMVSQGPHVAGISASDINNDGYLDLFIALWAGPISFYLNNGDKTFTLITDSSGIDDSINYWQAVFHDFDRDGWQDIFVAVDFFPDRLYINQHDNTFIDVAPQVGLDNIMNDMGVTLGDYDNDGDLDIYVTNIFGVELGMPEHNVLHRNDSTEGKLQFTEVSQLLGVDEGFWGWGTTFFDCNNDGWLDIAATNGFSHTHLDDPSKFFLNLGGPDVTFLDVSSAVGFDDTFWGAGLAAFDSDRDGHLDLMQACNLGDPLRLLANMPEEGAEPGHYVIIKPRMEGPNHRAIGAVVRATAGGLEQMRLITAGTSFMSQEPAEAHFGLADATIVESVTIEWPDGTESTYEDLAADTVHTLFPTAALIPGDLNGDGVVGFADLLILLATWGECNAECPADLDASGAVGFADLLILLSNWG